MRAHKFVTSYMRLVGGIGGEVGGTSPRSRILKEQGTAVLPHLEDPACDQPAITQFSASGRHIVFLPEPVP